MIHNCSDGQRLFFFRLPDDLTAAWITDRWQVISHATGYSFRLGAPRRLLWFRNGQQVAQWKKAA